MKADARLRMEVYQEGQRAFAAGDGACPYPLTDWRAGTWSKGWLAAREWIESLAMGFDQPVKTRAVTSAGWTIRRVGHHLALESPEGDGTGITLREHGDVFRYFDALLKENGQ